MGDMRAQPVSIATVFERLRQWRDERPERSPWEAFARGDWPRLFQLLDVGVQFDAIRWSGWTERLGDSPWPLLEEIDSQGALLESLRETPWVGPETQPLPVHGSETGQLAAASLHGDRVVAVDFLLDSAGQAAVGQLFADEQARQSGDFRRELARGPDQPWFDVVERSLARPAVAGLLAAVGRVARLELTISSQTLLPHGIGWHRDLYWPQADNCVSIIMTLDHNSLGQGGEFLAWLPEGNRQVAHARRPFEATLLWNGVPRRERLFHAVAGYRQSGMRRDTFIVQAVLDSPAG